MPYTSRRVTIKDVASRAGVSFSAVSKILRGGSEFRFNEETRRRVLAAARELEYSPHAAARALAARRTQTIGFLCFELSDPYQATLAQAVQGLLEKRGYHLVVCSANRESEREAAYTRWLSESRVDGILVVASTGASQMVAQELKDRRAIIVAAGPSLLPETSDVFTASVAHDNLHGGRLIGQHLGELGHRRVGFTAPGGLSRHTSSLRLQGLRQGLAACGVHDEVRLVDAADNTFEGGLRATRLLLEQCPDITAIFAYNDRVALGALQALWRAGRRVPEEIAVVGYQDLPFASYTVPPLTTARIPVPQIAEIATGLLFHALDGEEIEERQVTVRPELIVRESTVGTLGG